MARGDRGAVSKDSLVYDLIIIGPYRAVKSLKNSCQ